MRKTHLTVLAIVVAVVVLAVGAVAAYADITTDSLAPVTETNAGTSYWNTVAITATATDNEGIAYVYNRVDGGPVRLTRVAGGPTSVDVTIPAANDLPLAAGSHELKYWAQDVNGNVEDQHETSFTVAIDTAKPVDVGHGRDWWRLVQGGGDGASRRRRRRRRKRSPGAVLLARRRGSDSRRSYGRRRRSGYRWPARDRVSRDRRRGKRRD